MTRETKLGLVVGVSFLSLAGFVGYNTYFKGEGPPPLPPEPPQPVAQVAQNKALPPQTSPQPNPGLINTQAIKGVPEVQPPGKNFEPTPPPGFGNFSKDGGLAPPLPQVGAGPLQPPPTPGGISLPGAPPVPPPSTGGQIPLPGNPGTGAVAPPGPLAGLPSGPGAVTPPGPGTGGALNIPPGTQGLPGQQFKSPAAAVNPTPPLLPGQPPKAADVALPTPGPGPLQTPATDFGKSPPGLPGLPGGETAKLPGAPLGAIPPGPLSVDPPPKGPLTADIKTNPSVPAVPPPSGLPPLTGDKPPTPPPTGLGSAPQPVGPLAGSPPTPAMGDPLLGKNPTPTPDKVPVIPTPGGGATTTQIPVPLSQPVPATFSGKPQVEHYDAKIHSITADDTDFATLSKKYYEGSDRYAQALIEYNRDEFGKDAIAQAPRVAPGSKVLIPPLHVLETKYPNAIAGLKPIQPETPKSFDPGPSVPPKPMVKIVDGPASGSPSVPPPPAVAPWGTQPAPPPTQPPQPIQPTQPSQPAIPPPPSQSFGPASPQTSANTPTPGTYVVPPPGQHYYQIAQQALGNPSRWSEIYQLNQQHDPSSIVPAGTQLQLPPVTPAGGRFNDDESFKFGVGVQF